jgi:hypothetical protein
MKARPRDWASMPPHEAVGFTEIVTDGQEGVG